MKKSPKKGEEYAFSPSPILGGVYRKKLLVPLFFLMCTVGYAQTSVATLPLELKINGASSLKNVPGLKFPSSFNHYYYSNGSLRFSSSSDYLTVTFDKAAEAVTVKKTTGGIGSVFVVSGSVEGNSYEVIEHLKVTSSSTQELSTKNAINPLFRCVRINYVHASNVGVSLLQITEKEETSALVVAPPLFSLPEGTYTSSQSVTIECAKETTVYYTTDGSIPTPSAQAYSGGSIEIPSSMTLKAIAYDTEGNASKVVSASYHLLLHTTGAQMYRNLFSETFDKNLYYGGNDGYWMGFAMSTAEIATDYEGWSFNNAFPASQCVVLGTSLREAGKAMTPMLSLSGEARLRFRAGVWNTAAEANELTVKILNAQGGLSLDETSVPARSVTISLEKGVFSAYEVRITNVTEGETYLVFESNPTTSKNARFFLDEVEVLGPVEELSEHVSALSGKWDLEDLADKLGVLGENEHTSLHLPVGMKYLEGMVVDNTGGNPNLLVYSSSSIPVLVNALNVVNGRFNVAAQLTDSTSFHAPDEICGEVCMKRNFTGVTEGSGGWQVIGVPFTVTRVTRGDTEYIPYCEWIQTQPYDKGFFWLKTVHPTGTTNDIDTDASSIEANTPYIIAFPNYDYKDFPLLCVAAPTEFVFSGEGVQATDALVATAMRNWSFQPSYLSHTDENCYVLNAAGDQFELLSPKMHTLQSSVTTVPFRPFLRYKKVSEAPSPSFFLIGADNTPLSVAAAEEEVAGKPEVISTTGGLRILSPRQDELYVYSLAGALLHRITLQPGETLLALPPGVYVVHGEKRIIQ